MLLDPFTDTPSGAKQLFDELYDPALLIDPQAGCFVGANEAATAFLGYDAEEFAKLTPADIHPHEIPRLDRFLEAVAENRRWSTDELACRTKQGALLPANVRASVLNIEGKSYILAIFRDRREEELAELGRSIRKLTHDLRNTMVASRLMSDRLRRHEDPRVQRSAELITRSVDRAVRMCQEALDAGSSVEPAPRCERFALSDVISEITAAMGPGEVAGASLDAPGAERITMDADFDQTFRVVLNLVRNALAAGATRIVVTGSSEGDTTLVDIRDNGPGIPESVQERLFQEKTSSSASDSTGLGLAIAWELVRNQNGELTLLETGPNGTVFRMTLPARPLPSDA